MNNNPKAFLELVRAGLGEQEGQLLPFGKIDYEEVFRLAEGHSVDGIVTAFAAFVIDYLGMPAKAMSLYDSSNRWDKKA